jgi:peroxiredoxin
VAPDSSITGFDGRQINLIELLGQVVVVNFWPLSGDPCRDEAAYLEESW